MSAPTQETNNHLSVTGTAVSLAGPSTSCEPPPPTNNNNNKDEPPTAAPAHFFRPIKFESTPATPESNGSVDSAYGSATTEEAVEQPGEPTDPAEPPVEPGTIVAILQSKSLWKSFRKIGNEMIVTKPGRLVLAS